ncbi:MAG TPA: beta-ketoacyl-ACP synthase III [Anaerolineae bacterium]|nr:beta-ketoacyl-ACP synthase III [Anaerolineae bacterium]
MTYAHIVGWGKFVPPKILTNNDLSKIVDTSDEWIVTRTGIRERRIAGPKDSSATMGLAAAKDAIEMAGVRPTEIDLIICATATPEHYFPSTASLIQDALGATKAGAFDLSAGCSGFMYGLSMAAQIIQGGGHQVILVIGTETLSRIMNWQDRTTCVLFGDGAGAMVLKASDNKGGLLSSLTRSDGSGGDLLIIPAGGSHLPATAETVQLGQHFIQMNGREVFRFAARVIDRATREVVGKAGLTLDDIDLFIPHQANLRIIQAAARSLAVKEDRIFVNLDRYGNTSSASIPIAICEAVEQGRLKPGDKIVMVGFGAGLTWAAAAVQWTGLEPIHQPNAVERSIDRIIYFGAAIRNRVVRVLRRIESALFGSPSPKTIDKGGKDKK